MLFYIHILYGIALEISETSLVGIVLAFALIKFMTHSDKIVRKIFRIRSGTKYSILDNNLSAQEDLMSTAQGLIAGGAIGKAYKNKWLKPVYGKSFQFAKNVLGIPFEGVRAGVVTGARQLVSNGVQSQNHPMLNGFLNAVASSTLAHERKPLLDKNGNPILGSDGKPLFTEDRKWTPKGQFVFCKDGRLRYYEVNNTSRAVSSDIDRHIAAERRKMSRQNLKALKTYAAMGIGALKGSALMVVSIPFLIDNPMVGMNLFLNGYASASPMYTNRRNVKIKGFRKPVRKTKFKFKDFGSKFKNIVKEVAFAVPNIYIKPIKNTKYIFMELGEQQEQDAKKIQILYDLRETEADIVEDIQLISDTIKTLRKSDPTLADDINKELDQSLMDYAKRVYGQQFYKYLDKNIKENATDFRTKLQIRNFFEEYIKNNSGVTLDINDRKLQSVIRTENPSSRRSQVYVESIAKINKKSSVVRKLKIASSAPKNIKFEEKFEKKLSELKAKGKTTVDENDLIEITNNIIREEDIKNNLRSLNLKLSNGRTANDKFETDISEIEIVKEELRNIYGEQLGSKFELQMDDLVEAKKKAGNTNISEAEVQSLINNIITNEKAKTNAQFTEKDISGIKDEIDQFMSDNGVDITFDDELEKIIVDRINDSSNTQTNFKNEKYINGEQLKDILYEAIESKKNPNEEAILNKEEVIDLIDMIKEDNKGKDIKFGKEFEESINRLMQEEIVKRTIEEHVKTDTKNSKDEATLQKLEQKINDKLEDNGYHVKLDDVLNNKDITSNLYDSLERNLNEQIEEKDMKPSKTEVEALTDMISDAAKQENSIHRELKYNGKPLNYRVTEKFVKDIEKMRALNHKASKMKMDRTERNGKSFAPDVEEPVTNINEIVKDIWENAKK